ncbi:lytic polysaccharide monooxygenase [Morganella morganii]|uniref:lytic polysaccharide monooxygenase n=1 Tax=Morganella morganii TaxID=582 RepID=UPI0030FE6654
MTEPASRAANCREGKNPATLCGAARWEPQSIEALSGFPEGNFPPDGHLASGGIPRFLPLDIPWKQQMASAGGKTGKHHVHLENYSGSQNP